MFFAALESLPVSNRKNIISKSAFVFTLNPAN